MQRNFLLQLLSIGIVATLCTLNAEARWASKEDASFIRHLNKMDIQVSKDGTFSYVHEFEDEILKDSARRSAGSFRTGYNSNTSTFTVIEAFTINDGKKIPVEPKYIQDKPLASTGKGFDEIHQVLIAFPKVDIGSRIRLKYRIDTNQIPFSSFYSDTFVFGSSRYDKTSSIHIDSEMPLIVREHDPGNFVSLSKWKRKGRYHYKIELRKPIYKRIIDEELVSVDGNFYPWVDVASTEKWEKMVAPVVKTYEDIVSSSIPSVFSEVLQQARKMPKGTKQINFVTSQISEKIHYLGDWRPINGGHIPRPLATIADTGFGDCKDMSALVAALLRQLGYEANVAFIYRDWNPILSPTNLPRVSAFNHAVVWAKDNKETYWLDPTNMASFAEGVYEDIIDRPALIIDPKNTRLVHTPKGTPKDSEIKADTLVSIDPKKQRYQVSGSLSYSGRAAIPYTGATLNSSKQSIDYRIISTLGQPGRMESWQVGDYDLSSRIVKDLNIRFIYVETDAEFRTSAGPAFPLTSNWFVKTLLAKTQDRVSNLFLGQPITYSRQIRIKNVDIVGDEDTLSCEISSPWADMSRELKVEKNAILVVDKVTIKQKEIPNASLRSKSFAAVQRKIRQCFDGSAIIYRPKSKAVLTKN